MDFLGTHSIKKTKPLRRVICAENGAGLMCGQSNKQEKPSGSNFLSTGSGETLPPVGEVGGLVGMGSSHISFPLRASAAATENLTQALSSQGPQSKIHNVSTLLATGTYPSWP